MEIVHKLVGFARSDLNIGRIKWVFRQGFGHPPRLDETSCSYRVEAPCLGKNTMAAANALAAANMALAGFDHLIPIDEVIIAMAKVGKQMPRELCCTGLGGIAICP